MSAQRQRRVSWRWPSRWLASTVAKRRLEAEEGVIERVGGAGDVVLEGAATPERVAAGGLDADDVGAQVGEEFGAVDAALVDEVEDADAIERAGGGLVVGHYFLCELPLSLGASVAEAPGRGEWRGSGTG